jgi:hypothetical protein
LSQFATAEPLVRKASDNFVVFDRTGRRQLRTAKN